MVALTANEKHTIKVILINALVSTAITGIGWGIYVGIQNSSGAKDSSVYSIRKFYLDNPNGDNPSFTKFILELDEDGTYKDKRLAKNSSKWESHTGSFMNEEGNYIKVTFAETTEPTTFDENKDGTELYLTTDAFTDRLGKLDSNGNYSWPVSLYTFKLYD
jgi:hypothetical protein